MSLAFDSPRPTIGEVMDPLSSEWVCDVTVIAHALCEAEGQRWDEAGTPDKDRWGRTAALVVCRRQDAGL